MGKVWGVCRWLGKLLQREGVIQPGVRLFLQVGDTCDHDIQIKILGAVACSDEDGGEHPRGVPTPYHVEVSKTARLLVTGDTSS